MSSSSWPPSSGLSTPSVNRKDAIFPISASTTINAPASIVWQVLLETAAWENWNTFVPRVSIESQPDGVEATSKTLHLGTLMSLQVVMDPSKPSKITPTGVRVVDISTPDKHSSHVSGDLLEKDGSFTPDLNTVYRISWKTEGGYASRGLISERFHEIIITSDKTCEVRTWEVFGGFLARTVKWFYAGTLKDRFADWVRDLQQQSEKVFQASQESR